MCKRRIVHRRVVLCLRQRGTVRRTTLRHEWEKNFTEFTLLSLENECTGNCCFSTNCSRSRLHRIHYSSWRTMWAVVIFSPWSQLHAKSRIFSKLNYISVVLFQCSVRPSLASTENASWRQGRRSDCRLESASASSASAEFCVSLRFSHQDSSKNRHNIS